MRTERPRKTKIGIEVADVTCDSDTTFKVKGQGHQAALLTAALTREGDAAVTVRTYWAWETTATMCLFGGARGPWVPTGRRGGYISCRHAHTLYMLRYYSISFDRFCWRRSIVVRTLVSVGELSLSCVRLLAGRVNTLWLSRPLSVSQHGQLSHPSLRGR